MERKVSYPTKIAGGILIALLTFALLAQLLLVFLIVTFGKDWFFTTAEYETPNQAYAGIIALILGTLIVGFIIGISIITGLSLVFNTIFYLRCLRGKISIFAMVTNLVLISIAFILIAPSYTGLSPQISSILLLL
jgi:hypothetical protein